MTEHLPEGADVEAIVGVQRHDTLHYGRADPREQVLHILHSRECVDSGIDLRQCPFSLALDVGAPTDVWEGYENQPVELAITDHCGQLIPAALLDDGDD
jgi:hypothetical protein